MTDLYGARDPWGIPPGLPGRPDYRPGETRPAGSDFTRGRHCGGSPRNGLPEPMRYDPKRRPAREAERRRDQQIEELVARARAEAARRNEEPQ